MAAGIIFIFSVNGTASLVFSFSIILLAYHQSGDRLKDTSHDSTQCSEYRGEYCAQNRVCYLLSINNVASFTSASLRVM